MITFSLEFEQQKEKAGCSSSSHRMCKQMFLNLQLQFWVRGNLCFAIATAGCLRTLELFWLIPLPCGLYWPHVAIAGNPTSGLHRCQLVALLSSHTLLGHTNSCYVPSPQKQMKSGQDAQRPTGALTFWALSQWEILWDPHENTPRMMVKPQNTNDCGSPISQCKPSSTIKGTILY